MRFTFLVIGLILVSNMVHGKDWVRLNVGEKSFKLRKQTLTKYDGYFKALFNRQTKEARPNNNGDYRIKIARDPEGFRLVAQFLRLGKVFCHDVALLKLARNEAGFYGLQEMVALVNEKLSELPKKPEKWGRGSGVFVGNLAELKNFLNNNEQRLLTFSLLKKEDHKINKYINRFKPVFFVIYTYEYPLEN